MPSNNMLKGAISVLGLLMLVGCASNQATSSDDTVKASEVTSAPSAKGGEPVSESAVMPPKPPVVVMNPTVVVFEKMSVVLDSESRETIVQISEKARTAGKITVTGFCDRNQIKNATDSAVARAVVTRDELIAQGVSPSNITVKFSTVVAKKHAAEIKFEELELTKKSATVAAKSVQKPKN
jgi:outer membrane protein OmpA-like peptidoglycan-associated protein